MENHQIKQQILLLKPRLEALKGCLHSLGFIFNPNDILPVPDSRNVEIIRRIEESVGEVPLALKEFYREIGSINFNGYHPDWKGCEYPDALIVFPAHCAECELEDFLSDTDKYIEAYGSFRIPIAPDFYHKQNVSGGMWYGIPIPYESPDPPLLEERHNTSFLNYLEIALHWGGFPGLENAGATHNWPLAALREAR